MPETLDTATHEYVPQNSGLVRPIRIVAERGSLANPTFPCATIGRFCPALRRFATAKGAPDKYHETMTVAYMLIIAERIDSTASRDWAEFAVSNPDLLTRTPSVLSRYYTDETLASERARRGFVMPDRVGSVGESPVG